MRTIAERNQLVEKNMKLVDMVIWKYCRHFLQHAEYDDLQSVGYIGLINAATSFDESKGFKFSTYACHTIYGNIRRFMRDNLNTLKIPRKVKALLYHFYLAQDEGLTGDEVAGKLGISVQEANQLIADAYNANTLPLETVITGKDGSFTELKDMLPYTVDYDSNLIIEEFYHKLTPTEKKIVQLRSMGKKQKEIAAITNISQAHISRLLYGICYKLTGRASSLKDNVRGNVFRLLENGLSLQEIKQQLGVSESVVTSCNRIYRMVLKDRKKAV